MSDFNFKAGDKVYYPSATNKVLQVTSDLRVYYVSAEAVDDDDEYRVRAILIPNGKFFHSHHNPTFFPATQEWYDKLVHAYPNLEEPPKRKTRKELIQAMLDDGWQGVPCRVSNFELDGSAKRDIIVRFGDSLDYIYRNTDSYGWRFAKPFDPKTGKDIIDYVDGEVVLED